MSYVKYTIHYVIRFADEISYLAARSENLKSSPDILFSEFIMGEMYDKSKCVVESIEAIPDVPAIPANPANPDFYSGIEDVQITSNSVVIDDTPIDLSMPPGEIQIGNGDIHVSGNIYIGGNIISVNNNIVENNIVETFDTDEIKKEPEDPIENRFEILDL